MLMEWTSEVLRGWPADGARERSELIKQGTVLVNGDVVEPQIDGTVAKVSSTPSKRVGLVVRGNGDSASAGNANGVYMTPQPAKTATAMTWSAGVVTVTVTGHGYATGNIVTIAGVTPAGYNGSYVITVTDANTFTYALAADPTAVTVAGTSKLVSVMNNTGKAVVLWGNYIVRTSNYVAGSYVPGSIVTAKDGKYALATAASQSGTTPFEVTPGDPEVGYVLQVQGATATQSAHLVIVAY